MHRQYRAGWLRGIMKYARPPRRAKAYMSEVGALRRLNISDAALASFWYHQIPWFERD